MLKCSDILEWDQFLRHTYFHLFLLLDVKDNITFNSLNIIVLIISCQRSGSGPMVIVLARDPPSRHLGRVFGQFGGFWRGGQSLKTLKKALK